MEKLFKISLSLCLGLSFFFIFSPDVVANSLDEGEILNEDLLYEVFEEEELEAVLESGEIELFPLQIGDDEVLHFFREQDRDDFISERNSDFHLRSGGAPIERATVLSVATLRNQFLGYNSLTPHWAMASSYTITANRSMSFSTTITSGGLSAALNFSTSRSVATTFNANPNRASRLAATGDVTIERVRFDMFLGNTIISSRTALRTRGNPANIVHYVHYR